MGCVATLARWRLGAEHGIALAHAANAASDGAHGACKIISKYQWQACSAHQRHDPPSIAGASANIDGIDRGSGDAHHHRAAAGRGECQLAHM